MTKRAASRTISAEEKKQETEFARRRNDPHVDVRHVGPNDVVLIHHQLGEIGSRTDVMRRGKVVSVLYVLPPIPLQRWEVLSSEGVPLVVEANNEREAAQLAQETARRSDITLKTTRPRWVGVAGRGK